MRAGQKPRKLSCHAVTGGAAGTAVAAGGCRAELRARTQQVLLITKECAGITTAWTRRVLLGVLVYCCWFRPSLQGIAFYVQTLQGTGVHCRIAGVCMACNHGFIHSVYTSTQIYSGPGMGRTSGHPSCGSRGAKRCVIASMLRSYGCVLTRVSSPVIS